MDSQMKIGSSQGRYIKYGETAKSSITIPQNIEKSADMDVLELGKAEDPQVKQMEAELEKIRKFRFNDNKSKRKVQHNTAAIRIQILSSTNSMSARMALSAAYKEMASISVCSSSQGYDNKSAVKAMAQIKKVIAAGRMKVNNLSKEEQQELAIRRANKRLENQEIRELNRELLQRRARNRKAERQQSGNPKYNEQEKDVPFADLQSADLQSADLQSVGVATAGVATAGVATAGVATAGVATAGVATASLQTAGVATASLQTVGVATAGVATASLEGMSDLGSV